jgi:hypothetical protein
MHGGCQDRHGYYVGSPSTSCACISEPLVSVSALPDREVRENAEGIWDAVEGGIVSEGVAQVFDEVGNPHSHCGV